jgi:uncharacterized ion transporter superfamily protein YfcC
LKWSKLKSPDALVVVTAFLVLIVVLTWVLPAGEYAREVIDGRTVVVPGTYERAEQNPQGLGQLLTAPLRGFVSAAHIIGFVLLVGGAFSMVSATGALDSSLQRVLQMAQQRPALKKWIIPILMTIFAFAGGTFGMAEEILVFILITLPLARSLGYDAIVGVAIPFVGASMGFAGAAVNPFTVGIAQGIAELPLFSGWEYRWFVWAIYTLLGILFVMWYVRRLERDPKNSLLYGVAHLGTPAEKPEIIPFTNARKVIVALFLLSLIILMYGANRLDWYIDEIAALFIALGLVSAIIGRLSLSESVKSFSQGARDMLAAAMIIGISKSILVVAEDGMIIDTILFSLASAVEDMPNAISVQVMFFTQGLLNIIVPSGSGQAAITMPVMTPLADIIGISRQTAVLAFQMGDGLLNMVIPTSGVTMGILSIANIPYNIWLKWMWKFILLITVVSMVLLALPETVFSW